MKRSLHVYSLFGGKKENNDKNDDSPSKVWILLVILFYLSIN